MSDVRHTHTHRHSKNMGKGVWPRGARRLEDVDGDSSRSPMTFPRAVGWACPRAPRVSRPRHFGGHGDWICTDLTECFCCVLCTPGVTIIVPSIPYQARPPSCLEACRSSLSTQRWRELCNQPSIVKRSESMACLLAPQSVSYDPGQSTTGKFLGVIRNP
jgi:hypothetical protein